MSREDDVKTLSAGLHEFSTGNEWETLGVAAAIAAFVDARIREAMKPPEPSEPGDTLVQVPHAADCDSRRSTVVAAGGDRIGARMQPLPCSCDYWERALAANVKLAKHAPVEPEATAAKPSEACPSCRMSASGVCSKHAPGPAPAAKPPAAKAMVCGRCNSPLGDQTSCHQCGEEDCRVEAKPAAVGPEPPERVTLAVSELFGVGGLYDEDMYGRRGFVPVDYVRASAYEKAVELLRSAVERWPSYNVRDDVVAFLRAHDAPPPRHPADKHGDCTQCGGASHDGAC